METETSPPAARIAEIVEATLVSLETGAVPPQVGVQPPPLGARMKASWKALRPVAAITSVGFGGLLSSGIRYGAAAYQLLPRAAVVLAWALPPIEASSPPAASAAAPTVATMRLGVKRNTWTLLVGRRARTCVDACGREGAQGGGAPARIHGPSRVSDVST